MKHPNMKQDKNDKGGEAATAKKPVAFDLWLTRGLHRIYDDVASEPIPEELLNLIEEDRKK